MKLVEEQIAGPVVAAAVLFQEKVTEQNLIKIGVNDSKKLTFKQRERIYHTLMNMRDDNLLDSIILEINSEVIDNNGIVLSTNQAMQQALSEIKDYGVVFS